jgi:hypothetical protein
LKIVRRVLIAAAVTLALLALGVNWVVPVVTSIYAARNAPAIARLVPGELKDLSISPAPGHKLSYFGYEFEVPWTDLDQTQTRLHPENHPNQVVLTFRSGLHLQVTVLPAKEFIDNLGASFPGSPQAMNNFIEASFGHEATQSDYIFLKRLYEFTPAKMNCWSLSQRVHYREGFLLILKSASLPLWAKGGIFNIQSGSYKGFQQGAPQIRPPGIAASLYSNDGAVEFIFSQKNYQNSAGVSQSEINRVVQSLHKL